MIMDDNDGQMIFGDLVGLKLPDIRLRGEEKPRKTSPGKLVPTGNRTRARCVVSPILYIDPFNRPRRLLKEWHLFPFHLFSLQQWQSVIWNLGGCMFSMTIIYTRKSALPNLDHSFRFFTSLPDHSITEYWNNFIMYYLLYGPRPTSLAMFKNKLYIVEGEWWHLQYIPY